MHMLKEKIKNALQEALQAAGVAVDTIVIDYPVDTHHGDYATNVALVAAKKAGKKPMDLAEELKETLQKSDLFAKVEVAHPGFINFWIGNDPLIDSLHQFDKQIHVKTSLSGKKIMIEFAHPNTHKAFHIGHLRNITTGESIVRLLEVAGVAVIRANYQGDVGMHIAKAMYGLTMLINEGKVDTKELVDKHC